MAHCFGQRCVRVQRPVARVVWKGLGQVGGSSAQEKAGGGAFVTGTAGGKKMVTTTVGPSTVVTSSGAPGHGAGVASNLVGSLMFSGFEYILS